MFSSTLSGFLHFFSNSSSLKCSIPFSYISLHFSAIFLALPSLFWGLLFSCLPLEGQSIPTTLDLQWSYPFSVSTASCLLMMPRFIPPVQTLIDSQLLNISTWMYPGPLEFTDLKRSILPTPKLLFVLECLSQLEAPLYSFNKWEAKNLLWALNIRNSRIYSTLLT